MPGAWAARSEKAIPGRLNGRPAENKFSSRTIRPLIKPLTPNLTGGNGIENPERMIKSLPDFPRDDRGEMTREGPVARFGVFEADLEAGELRRSGVKIKLQAQPFQVLVVLLDRPGDIVTREELRRRLWSEDTFVDFDHSLNASINRLREALGDSATNSRFVETARPRNGALPSARMDAT
jgi:hypothetical protein